MAVSFSHSKDAKAVLLCSLLPPSTAAGSGHDWRAPTWRHTRAACTGVRCFGFRCPVSARDDTNRGRQSIEQLPPYICVAVVTMATYSPSTPNSPFLFQIWCFLAPRPWSLPIHEGVLVKGHKMPFTLCGWRLPRG